MSRDLYIRIFFIIIVLMNFTFSSNFFSDNLKFWMVHVIRVNIKKNYCFLYINSMRLHLIEVATVFKVIHILHSLLLLLFCDLKCCLWLDLCYCYIARSYVGSQISDIVMKSPFLYDDLIECIFLWSSSLFFHLCRCWCHHRRRRRRRRRTRRLLSLT